MCFNCIPDINECSDLDLCGAHTCVNTDGSFWCKCLSGFTHTQESQQFCVGKEMTSEVSDAKEIFASRVSDANKIYYP